MKLRMPNFASWYNGGGQEVAAATYGTNGGSSFTRPTTIPASSDTLLVSQTGYDNAARPDTFIDPSGMEVRVFYDDLGRTLKTIENYVDGIVTTGGADEDRTTLYSYRPDGQIETMTAVNPPLPLGEGQGEGLPILQTTTYLYGSTLEESGVASNHLLVAEIYPDSEDYVQNPLLVGPVQYPGASDRVTYAYNRAGQFIEMKDQNGSVHEYEYDDLGRLTSDAVTELGFGVDGSVRRLGYSYDSRGFLEKATSYSTISGTSGVVNQVQRKYNDFGQLTELLQAHDGAVGGSTPKVQYAYANGTDNHVRLTSMTYPNARQVDYDYGTAGDMEDVLSRVAAIKDGSTVMASYKYLGMGSVVEIDYEEPDVKLDLIGSSNAYSGFDRFGRLVDQKWVDYGSSTTIDQYEYGYDRAGNRLYKDNTLTTGLDELYSHDALHRLNGVERGTLNANQDAISSATFSQDWNLDALGNWGSFTEDSNGNGTDDIDQTRAHNEANEITQIDGDDDLTIDTGWVDPKHDANGNMTVMPNPDDPTKALAATYDAWNRMVKVSDISTGTPVTVAEYEYDATARRIEKETSTETRHYYYSSSWQIVEERVGTSTDADLQYVWGVRYVDELIARDRDTNNDGTLDQRHYVLQDAQFNVTAIIDTSGDVVERYVYSPYGQRTILESDWDIDSDQISNFKFEIGFQGLLHDVESGLIYNRYRIFHSVVGRFLQRDPLTYINGGSMYNGYHVMGGGVDPSGLDSVILVPPSSGGGDKKDGKVMAGGVCEQIAMMEVMDDYDHQLIVNNMEDAIGLLQALKESGVVIDRLIIYGHGECGSFDVGGEDVNGDSPGWREIGDTVTEDGEIQILGCNVAPKPNADGTGNYGERQVQKIADKTGRTVTASRGFVTLSLWPIPFSDDFFCADGWFTAEPKEVK